MNPTAEKSERIDLGLEILRVVKRPGQRLSIYDIAAFCDCAPQLIQQIEARALAKVRTAMAEERSRQRAELESKQEKQDFRTLVARAKRRGWIS
jgi:hypothetical protein